MRLPSLTWHTYLDPSRVRHDLGHPAVHDAIGHKIHLLLALAFCALACAPTSAVELASIPLIVFPLIRTPNIWRTWGSFIVQPLFLAVLAWAAWQATTLLWSPDPRRGVMELAANRWLWVLWALWPMMAHRRLLIAALAAGFLAGNLSQLLHAIGVHGGIGWLRWNRMPDRNSGWWDPVVGGSLLAGALGLHLPAAMMGKGRERTLGAAAALVTLAAIFATGTRGAWVAAAGLIVVTGVVAAWRWMRSAPGAEHPDRRRGALGALAAAGCVVLVVGFGGVALREPIGRRVALARGEIAAALERHDYHTDTGARVLMNYWAFKAVAAHPLGGVGAGGYKPWALAQERARGDAAPPIHAHAHSAPLHIAATTGLVGLTLAGVVVAIALIGAVRGLPGPGSVRWAAYDAGPAFALVGLLLAGLFDPVHLNAQTGALMAILYGMSLVSRP